MESLVLAFKSCKKHYKAWHRDFVPSVPTALFYMSFSGTLQSMCLRYSSIA